MRVTEFGWPLPRRQAFFHELSNDPNAKRYDAKLEFMGQDLIRPVWRISLTVPRYRLLNGRTSSLQQEWLAKNPGKPREFFTGDPERDEVQKVQHDLLRQLIGEKDLLPFFSDAKNKQDGYLILDHLGFIVNGNRRVCAWRELFAKDPKKYAHFAHIDVIILPRSDDTAIDKLEGQLQLETNILADYAWHAFANMLLDRMRLHRLDEKALARFYNRGETQIRQYIDMRNYAADYLKARGKEGQWSEVTATEFAFKEMVKHRKQINQTGEKRLFEASAFLLLDDPGGGRLYESIPELHEYGSQIRGKLLEEFPIEKPPENDDELLGTDPDEIVNQRLAEAIDDPANRAKAVEIIKGVIDTENSLRREKDSAQFVLKQAQKANALLQSALTGLHRTDAVRDGISETIDSIEKSLQTLRKWLNRNG